MKINPKTPAQIDILVISSTWLEGANEDNPTKDLDFLAPKCSIKGQTDVSIGFEDLKP
jgi:hypothetical protein